MDQTPNTINQKPEPKGLSLPVAIVLAAVIIGLALIVIRAPRTASQPTADTSIDITSLLQGVLASKAKLAIAPVTAKDHIRGATTPSVTIVEYSDLECPYCQRFHMTMEKVLENYGDKVAWVYRHYPLDCVDNTDSDCTPLHPKARNEAIASECAAAQGGNDAFWKFIDEIFAITPANNRLDPNELTATAQKIGLNTQTFDSCVANKTYADVVSSDAKGGLAIGVQGTPLSIAIDKDGNTYKIEGAYPYEVVSALIEKIAK